MSLQLLPRNQIKIAPDRQRKEFDAMKLEELATDLGNKGLMQAVVLRETPEGFFLVAGERRLRAIDTMEMLGYKLRYNNQPVPDGMVPYVTLGQLTPLQAEEAELSENLKRVNLSWQEEAAAHARLHAIRTQQATEQGRVHTVADTAMEVKGRSEGSAQQVVRQNIIVAKHLDNPEVAKAKTADEAMKILKRNEAIQKNLQLAVTVGKTYTAESAHSVHNVNCLDWMVVTDKRFDVILTDPPYGMGADNFGNSDGRGDNFTHAYNDSHENWTQLMSKWATLSFEVTKPQAHAYVFCDLDRFHELKLMMQQAGWYVFRTPLIHNKPGSGRVPLPTEGPRRQYELILYAIKGHKNVNSIQPDVINTSADGVMLHGAQKPVALYIDLLRRSCKPGDEVLDCFAGSGTILPAAHELKLKATAIEQEPQYYGICLKRMQDLDLPSSAAGADLGAQILAMAGRGK